MIWAKLIWQGQQATLLLPPAAVEHLRLTPQESALSLELLADHFMAAAGSHGAMIAAILFAERQMNWHDPRWEENLPPPLEIKEIWPDA